MSDPKRGTEGEYDNGLAEDLEAGSDAMPPAHSLDDLLTIGLAEDEAEEAQKAHELTPKKFAEIRARAAKAAGADLYLLEKLDAIGAR